MRRLVLSIVFAVPALLWSSQPLHARHITDRLRTAIQNTADTDNIPVIIKLTERTDLSALEPISHSDLRKRIIKTLRSDAELTQPGCMAFLNSKGVRQTKCLWVLNAIAAEVPAALVDEIDLLDGIDTISLDYKIELIPTTQIAQTAGQWNIDLVGAPALWDLGYSGQGVVVATMDSGVDINHPDLSENWRGGTNSWFDAHSTQTTPYDITGHGTQVMGIIAARTSDTTTVGIAPGVQWIAARVFDDSNIATVSDIHLGFQWILDPDGNPDTDDAPDIVNNSWTLQSVSGLCIDEFALDIQTLKTAGIAVVFGAGNQGPSPASAASPANYSNVFSAGAVDSASQITLFSSRGPSACHSDIFPNLVAPGSQIKTTDLSPAGSHNYITVSGTSFSAPHATAAMAILMSQFPLASVTDIESAMQTSAFDLGDPGPDYDYGFGLLDIPAASIWLEHLLANCPPDTDAIDSDKNGIIDDDNVCAVITAQNNNGDYTFHMQGKSVDQITRTIRLRQGQKLYLTFSNPDSSSQALAIEPLGQEQSAPVFSGSPISSFAVSPPNQFTYFFNASQPGTYLLIATSQTGSLCHTGQIIVDPIQNMTLSPGEQLPDHTHMIGDKYASNDNDGSTYYDREHIITLSGDNLEPLTVNQGQTILLRISNPTNADPCTLKTIGIEMEIITKGNHLLKTPTGTNLYYKTNSITIQPGQTIQAIIQTATTPTGSYLLYKTNPADLNNPIATQITIQ